MLNYGNKILIIGRISVICCGVVSLESWYEEYLAGDMRGSIDSAVIACLSLSLVSESYPSEMQVDHKP